MKSKSLAFTAVCLVLITGFASRAHSQSEGPDTLMKLEADFQKATAEKGWDGYITYYAEDGVELPNGGSIVQGKEAIRKSLGEWAPGTSLTWKPVKAEMAASGDLGYTYGTFEFHAKDKDGHPIVRYGKYATVWKKQKDGAWKVAMDMGNSAPEHQAQ